MFHRAIAVFIVALIAGALGLGVVAGTTVIAAKVVFAAVFLAFLVWAVFGFTRRGVP